MKLYHGDIVYAQSWDTLRAEEDSYLAVENGAVAGLYKVLPEELRSLPVTDFGRGLIIPAFSDLHIHAPQYAQRGNGMDLLLSDWLGTYTFPQEARFASNDYAEMIYTALVKDMLRNGSLHASFYATLHTDASLILARIMERNGMGGFVGKVNMDCGSPAYLCEETQQSLRDTERFLEQMQNFTAVKPILTPRFAPTCTREQLLGLGQLAKKYVCGMQTHLVESRWEAQEALRCFPECRSDAEIYERAGLLEHGPILFGHFIFPTQEDLRIAERYRAFAVHCPDATNNVIAGIMPLEMVHTYGIEALSGSDIGAGHSPAIYRQVARTVQLSKLKEFYEPELSHAVTLTNAFYMATKAGGSVFGNTGSFEPGSAFDALVLDGLEDGELRLSAVQRLERFCYLGDDRNIVKRYRAGEELTIE